MIDPLLSGGNRYDLSDPIETDITILVLTDTDLFHLRGKDPGRD